MNRSAFVLAAALSLAGLAVHAESPDPSGQFAARGGSAAVSRASVQQDYVANRAAVDAMNREDGGSAELAAQFRSSRTRAEVQAEYRASRNEVAAMNAEDSGSRYLAARDAVMVPRQLAGTPRNAH